MNARLFLFLNEAAILLPASPALLPLRQIWVSDKKPFITITFNFSHGNNCIYRTATSLNTG